MALTSWFTITANFLWWGGRNNGHDKPMATKRNKQNIVTCTDFGGSSWCKVLIYVKSKPWSGFTITIPFSVIVILMLRRHIYVISNIVRGMVVIFEFREREILICYGLIRIAYERPLHDLTAMLGHLVYHANHRLAMVCKAIPRSILTIVCNIGPSIQHVINYLYHNRRSAWNKEHIISISLYIYILSCISL